MTKFKLYIKSAKQVVLIRRDAKISVLRGKDMQTVQTMEEKDQCGISILVNRDGMIEYIGHDSDCERTYKEIQADKIIHAAGKCVLPGFVDAHTHPVWAGDRVHEFAMKLAGATYMEVHKAGGGIHYTVEHTREASEEELLTSLTERLKNMLICGTTFVECKSGYGLDAENEIKMLKVIHKARHIVQIGISSTYCGAHAVPK
ncbi:hypothetical protein KUTeg_020576 [Tegillarca granosa]|uniref:imidazolonepropionase n=1 Tax=Tegillarca granosa TaxID=220873 RepID=A0ABQ9EAU2_TEGGR|nr:hypothetical protein KUTeg_020576 [Tegillarca granosa]